MQVEISLKLDAGWRYDDEAGVFVAWCPALEIYSQGETENEARRGLTSALTLYVKHCFQRKILDNLLAERGFKPTAGDDDGVGQIIEIREVAEPPKYDPFTVDVPLHLIRGGVRGGDGACLLQ